MQSVAKNLVRSVSTLTPMASAFNKINHKVDLFPKFFQESTGLFGNDLLKEASGFYLLRENAVIESERLVNKALDPNRSQKMVQIFDTLSNSLCKVADLAEFVKIGHPARRFANNAEQASLAISKEVEKLNTNRRLYDALHKVVVDGDVVETNDIDKHVGQLFLHDFEQSGIHLNENDRRLVVQLNDYILHLGSYFMNSTRQPRTVVKSQLPEEIRHFFKSEGDDLIVTGLYNDNDNELVREAAYRIFLYGDERQESLLKELLKARLKLAKICGFKSYAHRAMARSIADTPEAVLQFLEYINEVLMQYARKDFDEMLKLKMSANRYSKSLKPWDVPYFTAIYKNKYNRDLISCSPYFSLGSCMEGLDLIFNSLYGVNLKVSPTKAGETWHTDVVKLSVVQNDTDETLGYIYCDFFERSSKPPNDCHFTIQGGCRLADGTFQLPIVVLLLSLPPPTNECPSFLSPHAVDNLFHEMGHAIHSMIARTSYQHISGTRCSTDLAEVPSILMEFFASEPRVVSLFAKHFKTGESIPQHLLDSWIQSKKVFLASDLQLQVFYSVLDQVFHSEDPFQGNNSTTEVLAKLQSKYYGVAHVDKTSWQLRFGHLVGYGAKYYSYLVSKSVAASIWNKLFIDNPLSSRAGSIFKNKVLAHGGGKPSKDIVNEILETDVSDQFLAKSLSHFIVNSYKI